MCPVGMWSQRLGAMQECSSHALKQKDVTYFNMTPDRPTLLILEAQGYVRYCSGRFVAAPALSASSCRSRVELVAPGIRFTIDGE
jgi:hypothetical protein